MTALMISTIEVTDPEKFSDYMAKTQAVASKYGAELVFRGKLAAALSDDNPREPLVVVARFPDIDALRAWNASPEYQDLVPLRKAGSRQVMTAYSEQ